MSATRSAAGAALLLLVAACAKPLTVTEAKGACSPVHGADVCVWARMHGDTVLAVGADVPFKSIEGAQPDTTMVWPPVAAAKIPIADAVTKQTGLTTLTMYWEGLGHPPGPFMTPHFDFHFLTVPLADVEAIDCKDLSKPAASPEGYELPDIPLPPPVAKMFGVNTLVGLCVPGMGMHALPKAQIEARDPFRQSMVVGYTKGKPIFIEPMLTREMLMEKKSFDLAIPAGGGLTGLSPRTFKATYDADGNRYRFEFTNFKTGT